MPWPIVIFFVALVGWPVLKLVATFWSRPLWDAQRIARDELLRCYQEGDYEPLVIEAEFLAGKGEILNLLMPLIACVAGLAILLTPGKRRSELGTVEGGIRIEKQLMELRYPKADPAALERLIRDQRFQDFQDRAFKLQALRYPVAAALTLVALMPALIIIGCFEGIRTSVRRSAKNMIEAGQGATKFFILLSLNRFTGPSSARTPLL